MTMTTQNKNDVSANLTTCANGLTANYPATQTWVFNGTPYKRGDLLAMLAVCTQAAQKTKADHDTWRGSVEVEREKLAELHPVLGALKKALEAEWGATSPKMAEFGFAPAKPRTRSVKAKAAGVAKATATRAAKKAALGAVKTAPAATDAEPAAKAAAPAAPIAVPPKNA
jgi:hypothetical protein